VIDISPAELDLAVAGTTLRVWRHGRGPVVVCLHATGHAARDFIRLAQRLGDRFELVAIDWPGQGASPRDHVPTSATRYAELLAGVIDRLALDRVALLGNSIGGAAALTYAATHPERVTALVLCNPGGLQRVGVLARVVCAYMARFFGGGERGDPGYAKRFRRNYERMVLPRAEAAWRRDEIVAGATAVATVMREAWQSFARPDADLRALVPTLACPVLYAWAKRDRIVAWSRSKRAALRAPRHKVEMFDGGHAAFLEQPAEFDAAFVSFMAGVSR
jgi:4,5:9,10-diseco-3-hydroxy-5,9,17-trioxoandrosta-1(10),2-diene-4-oate hydrolase